MRFRMNLCLLMLSLVACGGKNGGSDTAGTPEIISPPVSDTPTVKPDPLKYVELKTPHGDIIRTSLAYKSAHQLQGLSGVKPQDFQDDQGKLFFYFTDATRTFWMKNTFFALDIFYLDKTLKITDVVWNLPWYQGTVNADIPRAPAIRSRHVLEMKSGSSISSRLKVGDKFIWKSSLSLSETAEQMKLNL